MVLVAATLHAIVIFGVSFSAQVPETEQNPVLDVILVQTRSRETPKDPDYLAQANQDGSGNVAEPVHPRQPPPMPDKSPAEAPKPQPLEPELPHPAPRAQVLTQLEHSDTVVDVAPPPVKPPQLSAAELMNRSMRIATLSNQLNEALVAYSKRPRQKSISAKTREYKYASYMEAWVAKVERIGNLNYPDEARRNRLSGALLLDVAVRSDGGIENIVLLRSSGHQLLDDAAQRIVRLAAPFAPFPDEIRNETDILHIIRTWEFLSSNRLFSK